MNEIEILKIIMRTNNFSYKTLAEKLGYNTPSAVSNRLMGKTITVDTLVKLLSAMDCELIIRNCASNTESYIVKK